jgi:hypothetical protein
VVRLLPPLILPPPLVQTRLAHTIQAHHPLRHRLRAICLQTLYLLLAALQILGFPQLVQQLQQLAQQLQQQQALLAA